MSAVFVNQCPWYVAGALLGLLVVGMRWLGNLHLGALGGFVAAQGWAAAPERLPGWRVFFFVGMAGGGLLYALVTNSLEPTLANGSFDRLFGPTLPVKAAVLGGAGLLIGFGARTAGGCTSGHGVCGMAQLSRGSAATTATFVATAVVVAWLLGGLS